MVVSLLLMLNFSIRVSASSVYDRQEADGCITISERLSVKGGSNSKTYMTGTEGEEELARLVVGKSQQYQKTSLGGRYIDQLSADNIAHESKVGYTTLTKRIRTQILKDAELINTGRIEGAHWHFFTSGVTGKGGASQPLLDFLTENGISYTIH